MPEACMILIDNSEYMRNGDVQPSRWHAQSDAASLLFDAKTGMNPENTVGLLAMAGTGTGSRSAASASTPPKVSPQVLVTLTQDVGKVLSAIHATPYQPASDFFTSINVAQLALKYRQNKNARQRLIIFIGSPILNGAHEAESLESELLKMAKKLKKSNVAIDLILFGAEAHNDPDASTSSAAPSTSAKSQTELLTSFINAIGGEGDSQSNILVVPTGHHLLSDTIMNSAILGGSGLTGGNGGDHAMDGSGTESANNGGGQFEFGFDPALDPELAMVLRMSMEEEQARTAAAQNGSTAGDPSSASEAKMEMYDAAEDSEEAELQRALALSAEQPGTGSNQAGSGSGRSAEDEADEAEIAKALALSMEDDVDEKK